MSNISVEVLGDSTNEQRELTLASILQVQTRVYPAAWLDEDSESYYRSALASNTAIHVVVKGNGTVIGYLLAVPVNTVMNDLAPYDPSMATANTDAYYIDTFEVLPHNGFGAFRKVIRVLETELRRRHVDLLMCHARISNGLSKALKHYFADSVISTRRIEHWKWYGGEEPTEFLEIQFI